MSAAPTGRTHGCNPTDRRHFSLAPQESSTHGREAALSVLSHATVVSSDETGVRIEGTNSYH